MSGAALAGACEALVGSPFRLHGRDSATGLDCIGVLALALQAIGRQADLPDDYSARTRTIPRLNDMVRRLGFTDAQDQPIAGDVVLVRVGPLQLHLAIATGNDRYVHAHAGLGRVVVSALPDNWSTVGHWRLDTDLQG